jgi:hypothetical protein
VLDIVSAKHTPLVSNMSDLLAHKNLDIYKDALRYIGGIMSIEDEWSDKILIQNDVIEKITNVMYSAELEIVKEALWTLSNIVASGIPNI